jgi:tight adherence protein C
MGLLLLAAGVLLVGTAVWLALEMRRDAMRERLLFALEGPERAEPVDLGAGDYGLRGSAWFFHHVAGFLQSWTGRGVLMAAGTALGFLGALGSGTPARPAIGVGLASGILTLLATLWYLRWRQNSRACRIKRELPNALELLAAIMEGGQAFEAALVHVLREADLTHPLYFDLSVMNGACGRSAATCWRCRMSPAR